MKIRELISFCFLFLFSLTVLSQANEEWNRKDAAGNRYGAWKGFYPAGAVRYIGQFKNNNPIDTFQYFYEDGKLKSILVFDPDSAKKTFAIHFYSTGDTLAKGTYFDQKKNGIWITYGAQSVPVESGRYINNKKNGKWTIYYRNGVISEVIHFKDDIEDGPYKTYFESGQERMDAYYLDGAMHGQIIFYTENGKKEQEGEYVEGLKDGKWILYQENGLTDKVLIYEGGKLTNPEQLDSIDYNKDEFKGQRKDYLEFDDIRGKIRYE